MAKRCTKGKACGSTCIPQEKQCIVALVTNISGDLKKVTELLAGERKPETPVKKPEAAKKTDKNYDPESQLVRATEDVVRERNRGQKDANLSREQKKAISTYTSEKGDYEAINQILRKGSDKTIKKSHAETIRNLDEALEALPKNPGKDPFFRGVSATDVDELYISLKNAKPGDTFSDPAYSSHSADPNTALDFAYPPPSIVFINRSSKITPINTLSEVPSEEEALLPRGTNLTIRRVTEKDGTLYVEVD